MPTTMTHIDVGVSQVHLRVLGAKIIVIDPTTAVSVLTANLDLVVAIAPVKTTSTVDYRILLMKHCWQRMFHVHHQQRQGGVEVSSWTMITIIRDRDQDLISLAVVKAEVIEAVNYPRGPTRLRLRSYCRVIAAGEGAVQGRQQNLARV